LALPAGERPGGVIGRKHQTHVSQRLINQFLHLGWLHHSVLEPKRDVVVNTSHHGLVLGLLEHQPSRSIPRDEHFSRGHSVIGISQHSREQSCQRGFA
jgi:hypothetical protein